MNRLFALLAAAALAFSCAAPARAYTDEEQTELQIGQQEYQQLQQKGEIVSSSPYYAILNPIAQRIKRIADPQYFVPFHFIIVNESDPNAFAVPGGNVYVTTAMMKFAKNKEQLAGVLCHETSHDIHHDVYNLYQKDQQLSLYATGLALLLGRGSNQIANSLINIAANLQSLHFSRNVEENADQKGATTCAQAGLDPWGLVWLMQAFETANLPNPPEFVSDHPSNVHRVQALESEFASDPGLFGKFNPDEACATPLSYSGFYNQYKGSCGAPRRQASPSRPGTSSAPAPSRPTCPPGWKFCSRRA
ncbi:MAG TPA: M48 family metalloprotease [Candidatus Baltobacteraceae bacterium]|nr:M48 family metalloprotease [Candidatus Baltobacteraceae bacterium]